MAATKTAYLRSPKAARRVGTAFREAMCAIDGVRLFERFQALAEDLPEATVEGRHAPAYVRAIMEFASSDAEVDRDDARKFAQHFLAKQPAYSNSRTGVSAVLFETWVAKSGGTLFKKFVETVLDDGEASFLAVFEGVLDKEDVRRMVSETGSFAQIEPVIEAGAVNYADAEVFEFTMFSCKPVGERKSLDDIQPKSAVGNTQRGRVGTTAQPDRNESLLPSDRDAYDKVFEDGGLSRAAAKYVIGADAFDAATVEGGTLVIEDANETRWLSGDGGETWVPDVDALEEEGTRPPNYRKADTSKKCSNCRHFEADDSECELFDYIVKASMTCDRWAGLRNGASDDDEDDDADESEAHSAWFDEELYGGAFLDVTEVPAIEETPLDDLLPNAPIYETNPETGAIRSFFGAWSAFQAPVMDEGARYPATIIVVDGEAHAVDETCVTVTAVVDSVADIYPDLLAEGDMAVEAALREYVEEHGTLCENSPEVVALVEADDERPTVADRDAEIRARLVEAGVDGKNERDADVLRNAIALQLAPKWGRRLFKADFDGRFGSGAVMIRFTDRLATAPEIDHLNAKIQGMISIGPFDAEGVQTGPKLKASMFRGPKSKMGWRDKTGTAEQIIKHVVRILGNLPTHFTPLVEADDEEEDKGKKA